MPDLDIYSNIRIESDKNSLNNLLNAIEDFQISLNNFKGLDINIKNKKNYRQNTNDFYDDIELSNNDIPYTNDIGRKDMKNNHRNSYRNRRANKQRSKTPLLIGNYTSIRNSNGFNEAATNTYEIGNYES